MRDGVVLGVERRRRWPDALKLEILGEVGVNGWTVSDVARRHDITRQHLYQWRRALPVGGGTQTMSGSNQIVREPRCFSAFAVASGRSDHVWMYMDPA